MIKLIFNFFFFSFFFLVFFRKNTSIIKDIAVLCSGGIFLLAIIINHLFVLNKYKFQFKTVYTFHPNLDFPELPFTVGDIYFDIAEILVSHLQYFFLHFKLSFGIDHLSLLFFLLTTLLIFLCVLFAVHTISANNLFFYLFNLLFLEFLLIVIFFSLDILVFYIAFEAVLIPMFFLMGVFGTRERKSWAAYLLIFYTICGSLLLLVGILFLYYYCGSFNIEFYLTKLKIDQATQRTLWYFFALSFLSKIPMFPLHIWLPEAHVEAPTVGSVILAGILLKLGVYGLLRFNLCLFSSATFSGSPGIGVLCIAGIIISSYAAVVQTDFKRIIAYSSVAHMNTVVVGLFCLGSVGLKGALFQSISHGFVSSGLFFIIGTLYHRHGSRYMAYYGGLARLLPLYSLFFLFFAVSNISLPGTSAFIGELLIFIDCFSSNKILTGGVFPTMLLGAIYMLFCTNLLLFGSTIEIFLRGSKDLTKYEFTIFFSLFIFVLFLGICPYFLIDHIESIDWIITFQRYRF